VASSSVSEVVSYASPLCSSFCPYVFQDPFRSPILLLVWLLSWLGGVGGIGGGHSVSSDDGTKEGHLEW